MSKGNRCLFYLLPSPIPNFCHLKFSLIWLISSYFLPSHILWLFVLSLYLHSISVDFLHFSSHYLNFLAFSVLVYSSLYFLKWFYQFSMWCIQFIHPYPHPLIFLFVSVLSSCSLS
jgi:hypothetical protein